MVEKGANETRREEERKLGKGNGELRINYQLTLALARMAIHTQRQKNLVGPSMYTHNPDCLH